MLLSLKVCDIERDCETELDADPLFVTLVL